MRTTIAVTMSLLFFLLPLRARAESDTISLKELEQEAVQSNPELRMSEKKVESADEKKALAAALPDPMIGYMMQNVGAPFVWSVGKEDMSMQGLIVTQEIPFPGKLSTMGNAAGKIADRERENSREIKLRVLSSLRNSYYVYYLAFKSMEILIQTKDLMKNIQRIAETRYSTGQGMQQDVLRAQLEVSMLLDRIAEEERKKETQTSMINSLVGRNPLAPLGSPEALPRKALERNIDELASMAQAYSPLLVGKQRMVEQNEFEVSSRKKEYLPDMVVSGGWFKRGDLADVWQASIMFRVPLYFWNKSTGVRAANAELQSARYDLDATKLMVLSRMRDLHATAKTSEHHLDLYDTGIIPQARMALQSTMSNYQVGKTDFMALLDSQSLLLKYQLMEQEELVNLNKTLSQISEMTGEEL